MDLLNNLKIKYPNRFDIIVQVGIMKHIVLLFLVITIAASQAAVLHKVLLKDPGALCLDGSPGAYYILKGTAPERIIVYFEGGGWCGSTDLASTTQSCYQRSKGTLGSSKTYPDTVNFSQGILSNNVKNNFRQATKVFLKYCDGAGHQGYRASPLNYKDAKLYFRGQNITESQLAEVEKSQGLFSKATDIIVTGGSAGGLATFFWANYVREKAKAKNVYAVPDSGIFLDSPKLSSGQHSYRDSFINLLKLSNTDAAHPVTQCSKAHPNQLWRCMFAQQLYKYMKVPLFPVQSLYDTWSVANILGIACISAQSLSNCTEPQRNFIEQYRRNTSRVLQSIGRMTTHKNGYWAPSCAVHTFITGVHFYSSDFRVPQNSNNSIDSTMLGWITDDKSSHEHIDQVPWPLNKPCSGTSAIELFEESYE